ncbi:UNKNOWN [Stylonychia lemnae]|uniref:Uncharacterized protein n=1 Tax=Stylonychia lemnae TaxID=5949 RepID=A0A078ADJ9_STYLE|nr:UNKNOWN [Stylonychia lemnae]|eukprot:CDW78953.1 UNKNOWN [Stylonychia lemnae]
MRIIYTEKGYQVRQELINSNNSNHNQSDTTSQKTRDNTASQESVSSKRQRQSDSKGDIVIETPIQQIVPHDLKATLMPIQEMSFEYSDLSATSRSQFNKTHMRKGLVSQSMPNLNLDQSIHSKNSAIFPEITTEAQRAIQQCDFFFQIDVNKPKIKVSKKFRQIYQELQQKEEQSGVNSNAWRRFGFSPMDFKDSQYSQSLYTKYKNLGNDKSSNPSFNQTIHSQMGKKSFEQRSKSIIGSLRIDMDNQDDDFQSNSSPQLKIFNYPSITKDILSQRIIPGKLQSLPTIILNNEMKGKLSTQKQLKLIDGSKAIKPKRAKSNFIVEEIQRNKIGKQMVKQSEQEKSRIQIAKKITEQTDRKHNTHSQISPVNELKKEDVDDIDRILDPKSHDRYLQRIMKQKEKKYDKIWPRYNTGQVIPKIFKNELNLSFETSRISHNDYYQPDFSKFLSPISSYKSVNPRINKDFH